MSNMDLLQRQHQEIADILVKIESLAVPGKAKENCFDISLNIGLLSGKLLSHLNSEDKFLYPSLFNHSDLKVQQVSKRFAQEMGNLHNAFANYKKIYMLSQNIKDNPEQFINETKIIFSAIKNRVASEEKDLYPLVKQ